MGRGASDQELDITPVLRIVPDIFDVGESETHLRLVEALRILRSYGDLPLALGDPMTRGALRSALTDSEEQDLLREVIAAALQQLLDDEQKEPLSDSSLRAAVEAAVADLERGLRMDWSVLRGYLSEVAARASRS